MRKDQHTIPAKTLDSSRLQTIRQIASQARAFYLKDQTRASKSLPVPFDSLDKKRAYEYAKRAAERLGIDDEDLIVQASAFVHLSPKEWDARFPKPAPAPRRNVSTAPSEFEQQLEKTRQEAKLDPWALLPKRKKPFEGTALENAPGIKDLTDVPNETDLAVAAAWWGILRFLWTHYPHERFAFGWGDRIQKLSDNDLLPYVQGAALMIGGRELDDRELRAALNLVRLMAQHPSKDWDTLVGHGEEWEKRVGDATRAAQRTRSTNQSNRSEKNRGSSKTQ